MGRALAALALLWPLLQAAAIGAVVRGDEPLWAAATYVAASRVCHQRPERSFHTHGVRWPVCARCSGVYLGAALGVWFGFTARVRRWTRDRTVVLILIVCSLPTVVTWIAEWMAGLPVGNLARAVAGLPLGAAAGAVIVAAAAVVPRGHQVN